MAKNQFKTIGILGGIGPSASASMYSRIITHMQDEYKAWDDADFPRVMVYSTYLDGFNEKGIADPDEVVRDLVAAARKLEQMGSDMIVIACNTVHYFDKEVEQALKIPLIHMIDEACEDVKQRGFSKVGIACSQSTRDLALYSDGLKRVGVEAIIATDEEQSLINDAIKAVMSGAQDSHTIDDLNRVFERYASSGAEAILLGCTELPLAITQSDTATSLIDANDCVVKKAVKLAIAK